MKKSSARYIKLAYTTAGIVAATAYPQASFCADNAPLEEIIVTAQKREERLQDVPIAITVATEEQLQRDQVYSLTDLQRVTPALEVTQSFGGESTGGGRIRGIGTNVFNQTATGSVAIVIDQVPQGNASFPQLFDLAQVEVLRGPQGTLFGQTASAGVVNVRTAAPDPAAYASKFGLDFADQGTLGSKYSTRVVRSAVNMPITDNSAIRFATFYKNEIGVQRNVYLGRDNDTKDFSFRARYLLKPADDFTINLTAEYNTTDRDGVNFFAMSIAPTGVGTTSSNSAANQLNCGNSMKASAQEYCAETQPQEAIRNWGLTSLIEWSVGAVDLTAATGYRFKNRRQFDLNYSRQIGVPEANDRRIDNLANQFSQELRASSSGDSNLNYTAGLFYSRFNYKTQPIGDLPYGDSVTPVGFSVCQYNSPYYCPYVSGIVDLRPEFRRADVSVTAKSAFADVTYDFTDAFTAFTGLRYTTQEASFDYALFTADYPNGLSLNPTAPVKDNNLSGRAGFRFRFNEAAMLYGSFAKGYKGSLLDVTSPGQGVIVLDPEIATAYELGTKLTLLDRRLDVDANVFYTNIDSFQTQSNVFVGTALISIPNSVDLKSKGFEIDLIGNPTDNLSFNMGYLFNDIKFPDGYNGDDGTDMSGKQFVSSPKHKLSLSGELSKTMGTNAEGFVSLNAVYKSGLLLSARSDPRYIYPAHTTIGASIGMRSVDDRWTVSLYGRNLTNENEPIAYLASTWGGAVDGGIRAWPEGSITLRQIGLSFDTSF